VACGANFAKADGSIDFIAFEVDREVTAQLASRD
jgi:hypothetical protein